MVLTEGTMYSPLGILVVLISLLYVSNGAYLRCPRISIPNGRYRASSGFCRGASVSFVCNPGYTLVGSRTLTCVYRCGYRWSGPIPVCRGGGCPQLRAPMFGYVRQPSSIAVGSGACFTCRPNYQLIGARNLKCLYGGRWSGSPPTCRGGCTSLPAPCFGYVKRVGTRAFYSCRPGFTLIGTQTRTCTPANTWTGTAPSCGQACRRPPNPYNGLMITPGASFRIGASVRYRCNPGFTTRGSIFRTCTSGNGWNVQAPTCIKGSCGRPLAPTNGRVIIPTCRSIGPNTVAKFSCNFGYKRVGAELIKCGYNMRWSAPFPRCDPVLCARLATPANGQSRIPSIIKMQLKAKFWCNPGYRLQGSSESTCTARGWTSPSPKCVLISCSKPRPLANGRIAVPGVIKPNTEARFYCNYGYILKGYFIAKCLASGKWNRPMPCCTRVICPKPSPANVRVVVPNPTVPRSVARFSCNQGYKLVGALTVTCTTTGKWSGPFPRCIQITCSCPRAPTYGRVAVARPVRLLTVAKFNCNVGYRLVGSATSSCTATGWSLRFPKCIPILCSRPGAPAYGRVTVPSVIKPSVVAIFYCNAGYRLVGAARSVCTAAGRWSVAFPKCIRVTCARPSVPAYGRIVVPSPIFPNKKAQFYCNVGYRRVGYPEATCLPTGRWNRPFPKCVKVTCARPSVPAYGRIVVPSPIFPNKKAQFYCNVGYRRVGYPEATCLLTGKWNRPFPRCVPVTCARPSVPAYGRIVVPSPIFANKVAQFFCNVGYRPVGHLVATCLPTGKWNRPFPKCVQVLCTRPCAPRNGRVTVPSLIKPSTVAKFVCNNYYMLVGSATSVCGNNGQWSVAFPKCIPVLCARPAAPAYGSVNVANPIRPSVVATFACNRGYRLVGVAKSKCGTYGKWLSPFPKCVQVTCPRPGTIRYGRVVVPSLIKPSTEAKFVCNLGYRMVGFATSTCTFTGVWSQKFPKCVQITCPRPSAPAYGSVSVPSPIIPKRVATFTCRKGYRLYGSATSVCLLNGKWSAQFPKCVKVGPCVYGPSKEFQGTWSITKSGKTCQRWDSQTPHKHTRNDPSRFPDDSVAEAANNCRDPDGEGYPWCYTTTGTRWESCGLPTCLTCDSPAAPANGGVNTASPIVASVVATFYCNRGYKLVGSSTSTCTSDYDWSLPTPKCVQVLCTRPGALTNGRVTVPSPIKPSTVAKFVCNKDYRLVGSATSVCGNNGQWSVAFPKCIPVGPCVYGPSKEFQGTWSITQTGKACQRWDSQTPHKHTNTDPSRYPDDSVAEAANNCRDPDGTGYPWCYTTTGTRWESCGLPTCLTCDSPAAPANGGVKTPSPILASVVATFYCNNGYKLVGSCHSTCTNDYNWSLPTPKCVQVTCPRPSAPAYGSVSVPSPIIPKRVATFTCRTGYRLVGSNTSVCLLNGKWSVQFPKCVQVGPCYYGSSKEYQGTWSITKSGKTCQRWDSQTPHKHTRNDPSRFPDDSVAEAANNCRDPDGEGYPWCYTTTGTRWESCGLPTCLTCDSPAVPANGGVNTASPIVASVVATFYCNRGYKLVGSSTSTCTSDYDWSLPTPKCVQVLCVKPAAPANGAVNVPSPITPSTAAKFSCNYGYRLVGSYSSTCTYGGTWSARFPRCVKIVCSTPRSPANGRVDAPTPATPKSSATFFCNKGYRLAGATTSICMTSGIWSKPVPTCILITCSRPNNPANGGVNVPPIIKLSSVAKFYCNWLGYRLVGSRTSTCQASGTWSLPVPTCVLILCKDLAAPKNGRVDVPKPTKTSVVAKFICNAGYRLVGSAMSTCTLRGTWSVVPPTCVLITCTKPDAPENGDVSVPDPITPMSLATFTCNYGYILVGFAQSVCTSSGKWSGQFPTCRRVFCGRPKAPENGRVEAPDTLGVSSEAEFFCNDGYKLVGSKTTKCLATGKWSSQAPRCVEVCSRPSAPENGQIEIPSSLQVGNIAKYSCDKGYTLVGAVMVKCLTGGNWSFPAPDCEEVCAAPSAPENGFVDTSDGLFVDDIAKFTCKCSHKLVGSTTTTCVEGNKWSHPTPKCVPVCKPPSQPSYGNVDASNGLHIGATIVYSCNLGYRLKGSMTAKCLPALTWSHSVPSCVEVCSKPDTPKNGSVDTTNGFDVGATAKYSCNYGFILVGYDATTCMSGNVWSRSAPTCEEVCSEPTAPKNGEVDMSNGLEVGDVIAYSCHTGYVLEGEETAKCHSGDEWRPAMPSCVEVCSPAKPPLYGTVSSTGATVGSKATYYCDENYKLVGDDVRTCMSGDKWSGTLPKCVGVVQKCYKPSAPKNGEMFIPSGLTVGDKVIFSCNYGYELVGEKVILCLSVNKWSADTPVCTEDSIDSAFVQNRINWNGVVTTPRPCYSPSSFQLVGCLKAWAAMPHQCSNNRSLCSKPDAPDNGFVDASGSVPVGDSVTYSCKAGYRLIGDETRECKAGGSWTGKQAKCLEECPEPMNIGYGDVYVPVILVIGTVVKYSCDEGFQLEGPQSRTCLAGHKWSGSQPKCVEVCTKPEAPSNGDVDTSGGLNVGDVAKYSCDDGFVLDGQTSIVCMRGNKWSDAAPACVEVCPKPDSPVNGNVLVYVDVLKVGTIIKYICKYGYTLDGKEQRTCMPGHKWSETMPKCVEEVPETCSALAAPSNGDVETPGGVEIGDIAVYTCDDGYKLVGSITRKCMTDDKWSGEAPTCKEIVEEKCPLPATPDNGDVEVTGDSEVDDIAIYKCDDGYDLKGSVFRTCLKGGKWSGQCPQCVKEVPEKCPPPSEPSNGAVDVSGNGEVGDIAVYTCDDDYKLVGSFTRRCQSNNKWAGQDPKCVKQEKEQCGELPQPDNGAVGFSGNREVGDVALYDCDEGYNMTGECSRECLAGNKWSGKAPTCVKLVSEQCSRLPQPKNGDVEFSGNNEVGDIAVYNCDDGFKMEGGNAKRKCLPGDKWTGEAPQCVKDVPETCSDLPHSDNGDVELSGFEAEVGDVAVYSCYEGYKMVGESKRVCLTGDKWSSDAPKCVYEDIERCSKLAQPMNGDVEFSGNNEVGDIAVYSCDEGYRLEGGDANARRKCLPGDKWSGVAPKCVKDVPEKCSHPPQPDNGNVEFSCFEAVVGDVAVYSCDEGYKLIGNSERVCLTGGKWSGDAPKCVKEVLEQCSKLPQPSNGDVEFSGNNEVGDIAVYSCDEGYDMEGGDPTRNCLPGDKWSGEAPECVKKEPERCSPLPKFSNGDIEYSGDTNEVGDLAVYTCDCGYRLVGDDVRKCQPGDTWSGDAPKCVKKEVEYCSKVPAPTNGNVEFSGDREVDDVAVYTCDCGYGLVGVNKRTCLPGNKWSGNAPTCVKKDTESSQTSDEDSGTSDGSSGTSSETSGTSSDDSGTSDEDPGTSSDDSGTSSDDSGTSSDDYSGTSSDDYSGTSSDDYSGTSSDDYSGTSSDDSGTSSDDYYGSSYDYSSGSS